MDIREKGIEQLVTSPNVKMVVKRDPISIKWILIKGPFTLSVGVNIVTMLPISLWWNCLDYLLPSATKLRQGNIFTGVCQSFCSQGGMSASVHAGIHTPPEAHPPTVTARYASYWNAFLLYQASHFKKWATTLIDQMWCKCWLMLQINH